MDIEVRQLKKALQDNDADKLRELLQLTPYKADLLSQALPKAMGKTYLTVNRTANADPAKRGIYARKWEHTPTRSIRVPVALADDILSVAHEIDLGIDYKSEIEAILANHESKKKGYSGSNIKELIEDLKALL